MTESLFRVRRRSGGYLYWHEYKTRAARDKWLRIYYDRGDDLWTNDSSTLSGLVFLMDDARWHP